MNRLAIASLFSHNTPMSDNRQPSAQSSVILSGENIGVTRHGKAIIHDVDLAITDHDFVTIVGPNGAGKSTLLKVLLGIMPASDGKLYCKPGLKIGYVPQQFDVPSTMPLTVKGFLTLNATVSEEKIDGVLAQLSILAYKSTLIYKLSGGERQRVLIARALLKDPDLLVLDEPAQNLDVKGQLTLYKFLAHLYESRQTSILMVSHDLHMVMSISKSVMCLYGHICCAGEPQIIAKDPAFTNVFGEDFASMMSFYQHTHDHKHGGSHE